MSTLSISSRLKYLNTSTLVYHEMRVLVFLSEKLANSEHCLHVDVLEVFLPNHGY